MPENAINSINFFCCLVTFSEGCFVQVLPRVILWLLLNPLLRKLYEKLCNTAQRGSAQDSWICPCTQLYHLWLQDLVLLHLAQFCAARIHPLSLTNDWGTHLAESVGSWRLSDEGSLEITLDQKELLHPLYVLWKESFTSNDWSKHRYQGLDTCLN